MNLNGSVFLEQPGSHIHVNMNMKMTGCLSDMRCETAESCDNLHVTTWSPFMAGL